MDAIDAVPAVSFVGFPSGHVSPLLRPHIRDRATLQCFSTPQALRPFLAEGRRHAACVLHAVEGPVDLQPVMEGRAPVAVVSPTARPISGEYLVLLGARGAKLFAYRRTWTEVYGDLCGWLDGLLGGLPTQDLAHRLLEADERLRRCESVVRCVLGAPHSVRRLAHVAQALGTSGVAIRRLARSAGFARVEHLITYIRWRARELLRSETEWPRHRVDHAVGIRDRSNFRRQVVRVMRRSLSAPP